MACVLAPNRNRPDTKLEQARNHYFSDSIGECYNLMDSSPLLKALNRQKRPPGTLAKDLHPSRNPRATGIMPPAQQDGLTYSWYFGPSGTMVPQNPNVLRARRINGTETCSLPSLAPHSLTRQGVVSFPDLHQVGRK
jgi:hypothetical protein